MTDPYRPFPIGPTAVPAQFPRPRLERAGVPATAVDDLEAAFPSLSDEERDALVDYVNGHSDAAIAERFGDGVPPTPPAAPTEESLMEETVDALEDRIRKWNAEHEDDPEAHLAISGRKVELVARLLDAYAGDEATDSTPPAPTADSSSTVATGTVPTAPTPTTPEGAPTGTQAAGDAGTAPVAPATGGTTSTGGTP